MFKFVLRKIIIFIKIIYILILDKTNPIFIKNSYKKDIFGVVYKYFLNIKIHSKL